MEKPFQLLFYLPYASNELPVMQHCTIYEQDFNEICKNRCFVCIL